MKIASELLVERLIDWGVDVVFGLPGDGINGLTEGLRRHQDRIRFVLAVHEEAAAFMATAYAKSTGRLGVCLATSGPGGIHLLNGLYDAKLDHQPVLAITGMQETDLLGTGYQQEVHLEKLFMDVAEYDVMVHDPVQIPTLVDLACRTALARRTVSHTPEGGGTYADLGRRAASVQAFDTTIVVEGIDDIPRASRHCAHSSARRTRSLRRRTRTGAFAVLERSGKPVISVEAPPRSP